jgi:hypothetical protein
VAVSVGGGLRERADASGRQVEQLRDQRRWPELTVKLNGQVTTTFQNNDAFRSHSPGYLGLQVHTGRVAFANVRLL